MARESTICTVETWPSMWFNDM